jgi:DNA modification methylase
LPESPIRRRPRPAPRPGAERRLSGKARSRTEARPQPEVRVARKRRSLSHVGGKVELEGGTPEERRVLTEALAVSPDESATLAHVHGFHSYPARLHPDTARRLIEGLSRPGEAVLDSFCGSGTVLVEARLAGRRALGVDVNPLAVELSWLKTNGPGAPWAARLVEAAVFAAEHADSRRRAKAGATHRYGAEDVALFAPHVLLELDGLREGITHVEHEGLERALLLVLSAVLTKVSKSSSDTNRHEAKKRVASGFTLNFFVRKAEELARRLEEAREFLPARAPEARVIHGDARNLNGLRDRSVTLVVSSPPYPGVYDYIVHHRDRLRWLGLEAERFEEFEIGARRHARGASFGHALSRFRSELGAALSEMGRVIEPRGAAVLVIADSVLAGRPVRADEVVGGLARPAGLAVAALASQLRPHFHAPTERAFEDRARREHVVVLRRLAHASR